MRNKAKLSLLASGLGALGIWFYCAPYLAVNGMKSAAEARDAAKLSSYVNYPELKDSLKASLNAKLAAEMTRQEANPFAALGTAMAVAFIGPMVDAFVTPESLAMMLNGDKPQPGKNNKPQQVQDDSNIERSMFYESFDRFAVTIKKKADTRDPVAFVFNRDGLFSWRLSAIRLPMQRDD